jgi:hypothetical protein
MMNAYPPVAYTTNQLTLPMPDVNFPVKPRAKRELVPDDSKDNGYWIKRTKNNHSAKRSRWKRKCVEMALESRMTRLVQENMTLKKELELLKKAVGIGDEGFYSPSEQGYTQPAMNQTESQYYPMVKSEENNINYDVFNAFPGDSGQGYGLVVDEDGERNHLPHKLRHKVQTTRT